jgi:hypothetical protein
MDLNSADINRARSLSHVPVDELTRYLYGGQENVEMRQRVLNQLKDVPELDKHDLHHLNRTKAPCLSGGNGR